VISAVGAIYYRAADIGECPATASNICNAAYDEHEPLVMDRQQHT
jgi:hypothetical protein